MRNQRGFNPKNPFLGIAQDILWVAELKEQNTKKKRNCHDLWGLLYVVSVKFNKSLR